MDPSRALVGPVEVQAADGVIEAWRDRPIRSRIGDGELLELRTMIAAALADARTAGYLEGMRRGQVDTVQRVMETLKDL